MQIRVHENTHANLSVSMTPRGAWLLVVFGICLIALGLLIVYLLGWTVTIEIKDGLMRHPVALLQRLFPKEMAFPSAEIESFATEVKR